MILARISKAIRDQNWFAVVLEFVIVIAGVVIGFQVTAWNAERQDAIRGEDYAAGLIEDLQFEARTARLFSDYYSTVSTYAETAIELFEATPGEADLDFVIAAYNATQMVRGGQDRVTFDELVATGNIRLIPSRRLTETAVAYYRVNVRDIVGDYVVQSAYRNNLRRTMPFQVQEAIRNQCGDVRDESGYIVGLRTGCTIDLPAGEIAEAAQAVRAQPNMQADLRLYVSALDAAVADLVAQQRNLEEALALYEAEQFP